MPLSAPDWLTLQTTYISLSAVIAILIWIEAQMLKKTEGKIPKSLFFHVSSLLDTIWFFISVFAFFALDMQPLAQSIMAAYAIYTVFGWVYGTRLLTNKELPSSPKDIIVPVKYIAYSQSFALIFFLLCVFVLLSI